MIQTYIYSVLALYKVPACKKLIYEVIENRRLYTLRIPRTIVEEVRIYLSPEDFATFIRAINSLTTIDEDFFVPFELGVKYETRGFKMADAFIAAYAEWVGADILVTENRHFLKHNPELPFKVLTSDKCLKLIK